MQCDDFHELREMMTDIDVFCPVVEHGVLHQFTGPNHLIRTVCRYKHVVYVNGNYYEDVSVTSNVEAVVGLQTL